MKYSKQNKPRLPISPIALKKLLSKCITGDVSARQTIFNLFKGIIYWRIAKTLKKNYYSLYARKHIEAIAGDVIITLFDNSYETIKMAKNIEAFSAYVDTITRYRTIDYIRFHTKFKKAVPLEDCERRLEEECYAEPDIFVNESHEEKEKNIKLLERFLAEKTTKNEQEVIKLRYVENKEYHEIADELGVTTNSVGVALNRVHKKARKYFRLKGTAEDTRKAFSMFLFKTFKENPDKIYILLSKISKEDIPVCPQEELIVNYIAGNLGSSERKHIEAHITVCGKCKHSVKTSKTALTKFLQNTLPKPPKYLDKYIYEKVLLPK